MNKKGFTLLELLIAATIVGILAVFATVAYTNSAADTRAAGAKVKAEQLANAVQRYNLDPGACGAHCGGGTLSLGKLACCGLIENVGAFQDSYFKFSICDAGDTCYGGSGNLVCMTGKGTRLPPRYQGNGSNGYYYCVTSSGVTNEHMATEPKGK